VSREVRVSIAPCRSMDCPSSTARPAFYREAGPKPRRRFSFVLLPISDLTRGHATYSYPTAWKQYLAELLEQTKH
jgi:hypothetical protein